MLEMEFHPEECLAEAEEVVKKLRAALDRAGLALPSMCLEPTSYVRAQGCPVVELGRCNITTASRLAAALTAAERAGE
ncbi:hypothetical protein ACIO3O_19285 [Streptomyces sp. NPDC087440]|uniref:hypothetical protein n=1 Tax=Streptomyces sp. NPDC087440 TaxID=3365790 RepID=UPI0038133ACD